MEFSSRPNYPQLALLDPNDAEWLATQSARAWRAVAPAKQLAAAAGRPRRSVAHWQLEGVANALYELSAIIWRLGGYASANVYALLAHLEAVAHQSKFRNMSRTQLVACYWALTGTEATLEGAENHATQLIALTGDLGTQEAAVMAEGAKQLEWAGCIRELMRRKIDPRVVGARA